MARFFERRIGPLFLYESPVIDVCLHLCEFQPKPHYSSNDVVTTPLALAERLVAHFKPSGRVLEPCAGSGNFLRFLPGADWCEITLGRDFFNHSSRADWIITNPPWSLIRPFLCHSYELADDIAFLMTINHVWTKARLRDMSAHGFGLREIVLIETPLEFPPTGFQLGMVHYQRDFSGDIILRRLV